ncbi:APC family permease [Legionella rowbothamii]|uniref:APC family permease n=1 Tax=Legionella rowbothamii TaxID=96229 RepID=UPI0013EF91C9|nr:APC family permease [Legionella rowbothamii]
MAKSPLTVLSLTLITVGSVDSIRNLPVAALVGPDLFLYFVLAFLFFLFPCALIACWFVKQSPEGIYGWIKTSLGQQTGFLAIWFQWMQNLLIYPTFFSFIAGAFLYCIDPQLTQQKSILFIIINGLIWGLTYFNIRGINLSHRITILCTLCGLLIPFVLILVIGVLWLIMHPQSIHLSTPAHQETWTSLTAIILSFCGIEIAAVHAHDSKPGVFTKAIMLSVLIIFATMLFGSLTLAMLLSPQQLNFISGIPELFKLFFTQIHLEKITILINGLIVIGCIGCANSWLNSPLKGLLFASKDITKAEPTKTKVTQLLCIQAFGVSLISTLFLMLPSINASYWIMITLATQMYLLMYVLMFIGAIRLSWKQKSLHRWGILLTSLMGLIGIGIVFTVSFAQPPSFKQNSQLLYSLLLGLSLLLMAGTSLLGKNLLYYSQLPYLKNWRWKKAPENSLF